MKNDTTTRLIARPLGDLTQKVINQTAAYKFSNRIHILDPWWIIGGNKWTRTLFRLKHPIVYSKRGLRHVWRKIKRFFLKEKIYLCKTDW